MEERVAGSSSSSGAKDKKYVLYTVVGDDRARTTPASWVVRILLGSLMIVALAVVPYVSLRLAQANSRTLVVFQPVPVHNKTVGHRTGHRQAVPRVRTPSLMQVADLTLENYTASDLSNKSSKKNNSDTIISPTAGSDVGVLNVTTLNPVTPVVLSTANASVLLTLHESDVTLALLQDNSSIVDTNKTPTDIIETTVIPEAEIVTVFVPDALNVTTTPDSGRAENVTKNNTATSVTLTTTTVPPSSISVAAAKSTSSTKPKITTTKPTSKVKSTISPTNSTIIHLPETITPHKLIDSVPVTTQIVKNLPLIKKQTALSHKLVYVATSASGNHVGGICVWKVDKNVTNWSYFYENIPIEFQSGHDTGDHELRASLAAVRTWAGDWQDAHTTLRSQHNAIEHSDLAIRSVLVDELEKLSDGHFTYELEWRLPEADSLVKIAGSLSRLHQDYKFWFQDFKTNVEQLLGKQEWNIATAQKHINLEAKSFFTDESIETVDKASNELPSNISAVNASSVSTPKPRVKTPRPLSHKLVYVATSTSGNHVGGFCMWKLDKNITDWSYFYDNIPVEYQSYHDSADHEQRATLAAVRIWSPRWQDAHVTLRSQHAAIERSDSQIKKVLIDSLNRSSVGHFTYDLEWRLRKSDDLVKISFSLSRLNRNFAQWFAVFKASVDDVLGPQDWDTATQSKRVILTDEHFYTEETHPQVNQVNVDSTLAELDR